MTQLALTFYSVLRMPIDDIIECAQAAERSGFSHISVAESFYRDGAALATAIATKTTQIKLGTSVFPIYTRTPFQLAMAMATLNEVSHGRVGYLGLGIGYRSRTENYFGLTIERPLKRMREYVDIIRAMLSGSDTTHSGEIFHFTDFPRLVDKGLDIPIYFGSSGPRMLELAGEIADGVILNSLTTAEHVTHAKEMIQRGANNAGRDSTKITISASVIYSVSDDREEAARAAKEDILFYLGYPELRPLREQSGFTEEADAIVSAHRELGKDEALGRISQRMLDSFAIYGTASECRSKLRRWMNAGIDLPIIRVSNVPYSEENKKHVFLRAIESLQNF